MMPAYVTLTIMLPGSDQHKEVTHNPVADMPGYLAIKAMVEPHLGGMSLEHVTVLHNGQPADMFVGDLGVHNGHPRNEAATAIYRAATMARKPGTDPESLPAIHGPAVLCSRRVWF